MPKPMLRMMFGAWSSSCCRSTLVCPGGGVRICVSTPSAQPGHCADWTMRARYSNVVSVGSTRCSSAAMRATLGAAKDVPVASRSTAGPGVARVARTNSGQAAGMPPPPCTSGGWLLVRMKSPPYSTTSGLITSQMPGPEREKAEGQAGAVAKVRQAPCSKAS